jgi:hypothetical protein
MTIRQLEVSRFRGIRELHWKLGEGILCLVGPGDSTKSTILDAIDFALSPRWSIPLDDADFFDGDTSQPLTITVTVGDLPREFLKETKFGLNLRGWSATEGLHDEPAEGDQLVLSIRFTVDASLEPAWSVVTDRTPDGVRISSNDRELLGCTRIDSFMDRQFGWSKGSVLARLTGKFEELGKILADAGREAKKGWTEASAPKLNEVADGISEIVKPVGVKAKHHYQPHLDIREIDVKAGSLTLHDGDVPVRLNGLGTRRLMTVALQHELSRQGGIVLVDEVEYGLEPHRLRRLLRYFHEQGVGQMIMTTHSPIAVSELAGDGLLIVRSISGVTDVRVVDSSFRKLVRRYPEAFLATKIIVCEGETEMGVLLAMDLWWQLHAKESFAYLGIVPVDGGGYVPAAQYARRLSGLGYGVAYLGDSDDPPDEAGMIDANVTVLLWADALSIEERAARDLSWAAVVSVLRHGIAKKGEQTVRGSLIGIHGLTDALKTSQLLELAETPELRVAIGSAAKGGGWFKSLDDGEVFGRIIADDLPNALQLDLANKVSALRTWIDGDV